MKHNDRAVTESYNLLAIVWERLRGDGVDYMSGL